MTKQNNKHKLKIKCHYDKFHYKYDRGIQNPFKHLTQNFFTVGLNAYIEKIFRLFVGFYIYAIDLGNKTLFNETLIDEYLRKRCKKEFIVSHIFGVLLFIWDLWWFLTTGKFYTCPTFFNSVAGSMSSPRQLSSITDKIRYTDKIWHAFYCR